MITFSTLAQPVMRTPLITAWLSVSFFIFFSGPLLFDSYGRLVSVVAWITLLPALIWLLFHYAKQPLRGLVDGPNLLLLAIFFLGLTSLLWAENPQISRMIHGTLQIGVLFLFCRFLGTHYRAELTTSLILAALLTATTTLAIITIFYSENPISLPIYHHEQVLAGIFPNANQLIATMTIMAPAFILAGALMHSRGKALKLGLALGLISCTLFILLLQRRTGLVALAGGGITLILLSRSRAAILAILALGVTASYFIITDVNGYISRGDSLRFAVWGAYLEEASKHPWFGHGLSSGIPTLTPQSYPELAYPVVHPHNILISIFYYLGIAGLVTFGGFLVTLGYRLWQDGALQKRSNILFLAPLTPGLITLMFDGEKVITPYWPSWNCLWIPLALAAATLNFHRPKTDSSFPGNEEAPCKHDASEASRSG